MRGFISMMTGGIKANIASSLRSPVRLIANIGSFGVNLLMVLMIAAIASPLIAELILK